MGSRYTGRAARYGALDVGTWGLYYDLELKTIAAVRPRPAFLPVMRLI